LAEVKQFFRVRFCKQGDIRFISHHDLARLFERALRRAHLPLAMSRGFNPRPQMSLPAPLGVGIKGCNEVLDFELSQWVRPEEVRRRVATQLPKGIAIESLQNVASKPCRRPKRFSYRIPVLEGHPVTQGCIEDLLARETVTVPRRGKGTVKTVDIRPFIQEVRLEGSQVHVLLSVTDHGTARPGEVVLALGCRAGEHYFEGTIERTQVNLSPSL